MDPGSLIVLILTTTALLSTACLLARTVPTERANARHQIWTLALAGALLLPLIHGTVPGYLDLPGLPVSPGLSSQAVDDDATFAVLTDTETARRPAPLPETDGSLGLRNSVATRPSGPVARLTPPEGPRAVETLWHRAAGPLSGLWLLGTLIFATGLWRSYRAAGRVARRGVVAADRWAREAAHAARQLGLGATPEVRLVEDLEVPVATGLVRPRILLPTGAERWTRSRRLAVLLHETAHLRRRDLWTALIGELARAAYWFHPLVWLAVDRQRETAERACDQAVLTVGVTPRSYAGDLLAIAREARLPHFGAALAFGRQRRLRHRVESILSFRGGTSGHGRPAWLALLTLLLTLGVLGLLRPESSHLAAGPAVDSGAAARQAARRSSALEDLENGSAAKRLHAAWVLGQLETALAVDALHDALDDTEAEVRGMAAWALGEIKSPRSVPALIEALTEHDPLALEMIVKALGELEDPRASGALTGVLQAPGSPADLRRAAVWSLGEIAGREARRNPGREARSAALGSSAALAALDAALRTAPDEEVRAAAARAMPSGPDTAAALLAALDDREAAVRRAAAMQLGRAERSAVDASVPALVKALKDSSADVRREAATGLGRLRAPVAADALIARLRDDDPAVRDAATWALDELAGE